MRGAIPPLPEYVFMAWCLGKHRDNFTFYLYLILHIKANSMTAICFVPSMKMVKWFQENSLPESKDGIIENDLIKNS
jgi:hypothetical protein